MSKPTLEKNGYLLLNNPNLENNYKLSNENSILGSNEHYLLFGELQVYNSIRVEGELTILKGNQYLYDLNRDINYNQNIYGPIVINQEINIVKELSVL